MIKIKGIIELNTNVLKLHEVIKMPITHTQLTIFFSVLSVIIVFFVKYSLNKTKDELLLFSV